MSESLAYLQLNSSGLQPASTTGYVNIGTLTAPYSSQAYATYTSATCKMRNVATCATNTLKLVYNSLLNATVAGTPEVLFPNVFEIKASIEISGGTLVPVFFGGKRLILVQPGANITSDPVGIRLAAGDVFHVRTFINRIISNTFVDNVGEAGQITANQTNVASNVTFRGVAYSTTDGAVFSSSTGVDPFLQDYTDSGLIAASNNQGYGPTMVLGIPEVATPKSVIVLGDSISAGVGDGVVPTLGNTLSDKWSGRGYWPRAFQDTYSITQLACGGEQVGHVLANATFFRRGQFLNYGSTCIIALGTNDIAGAGLTASQTIAKLILLAAQMASRVQKVILCTIIPRSTSTDGWQTLGGQTTTSTLNFNKARLDVNNWIRTKASGYDFIDVAALMESGKDTGIFKAPGTPAESGTATGTSATTLTDSGKSWTTNQWAGYTVSASNDPASAAVIQSNTATALTVSAWNSTPSISNTYKINAAYTYDGVHPTPYGHSQMAAGVYLQGIL